MLKTSELQFTRISDFEDQAEGIPQYKEIIHALEQSKKNVGIDYANLRKENILKTRPNYYASCWIMKANESYLMWKNYTSFDEGILIQTTVKQLITSLDLKCFIKYNDKGVGELEETESVFFGEVDYNYQKKVETDHVRAFGKSDYFCDENEFRIVIYRNPPEENKIRRAIKNFSFINSITSSPKATNEFSDLLKKVVIEHSISDSIVRESAIKQSSKDILEDYIKRNSGTEQT